MPDLGGVGAALAEAGGVCVAEPVGAQSGIPASSPTARTTWASGDGEPATPPGPQRAVVGAALIEPGGQALAASRWQRDGADLIALAMQADVAGAGGEGDVADVQVPAFSDAGPGVQQRRDARPVRARTDRAPVGDETVNPYFT